MDVPKATAVAITLDRADARTLLTAAISALDEPFATEPERLAILSLACQLHCQLREL